VLLTATASSADCEQISTGQAPFESLAGKAHFVLSDAGRSVFG
jgi:hypothetical protein